MKKTIFLRAAMLLLTAFITSTVWATQPDKFLDACLGGDGYIYIYGWAYDPDAPEESIDVHVYIYTNANCTSEYVNHIIKADVLRTDVNEARHITGNHGFLAYIPINDAGNYWVKIFAIDTNGNGNPQIDNTTQVTVNNSQEMTLWGSLSYTTQDGKVLIGTTSGTVTIPAGASITLKNVTITGGIVCEGSATITLAGENSVTGANDMAGIQAGGTGTTLTIRGNGSLEATGGSYAAGIGGNWLSNCGNIVIESGVVNATSHDAAGIGSGFDSSCGNITISGGTVTAKGFVGIGGGIRGAQCGNITISGGDVTVQSNDGNDGIGIGGGISDGSRCGDIIISGGTVNITFNFFHVAIGCGGGTCGNITITDGVSSVTATVIWANYSIGKGDDEGTCGTITIGGEETGFIAQSPFTYRPDGTLQKIVFDANGGIGSMHNLYFSRINNDSWPLTANTFTRLGYTFREWNTAADGSGTAYNDGQNIGGSATLYAQWDAIVREMTDGTAYAQASDLDVVSATFTKTLGEERIGKHQAWLVPFDYTITSADLAKFNFYKINMIANSPSPEVEATNEMWVFLTKLDAGAVLHANMPYVYKPLETVTNYAFTSSNVTLKAKDEGIVLDTRTAEDIYSFYATYDNTTATEADPFYYVSINGGISLGTSATVGPYRWIIRKTSKYGSTPSYAREMHFYDGEDSSSSGIETMNWSESGSSKSAAVYTLDGRRVATDFDKQKSLQPGVYIVGGRKVVIK